MASSSSLVFKLLGASSVLEKKKKKNSVRDFINIFIVGGPKPSVVSDHQNVARKPRYIGKRRLNEKGVDHSQS